MLEESVIGKHKPQSPRYHDLDWLCGAITEKQFTEISKYLAKTRIIDRELWR